MNWKILFLDIDGVIRIFPNVNPELGFMLSTGKYFNEGFTTTCVNHLKWLLSFDPSIKIIISSDIRFSYSLNEMKEIFKFYGINPDVIIGYTPNLKMRADNIAYSRSMEIMEVVSLLQLTNWVAIDDIDLSHDITNYVITLNYEGITSFHIERCLHLLFLNQ